MMEEEDEEDILFDQSEYDNGDDEIYYDDHASLLSNQVQDLDLRPANQQMSKCMKVFETMSLCAAFFGLGLCIAIPGPTLLDLQQQTSTDTETISRLFTGRSVGYLVGTVVSGMLFDCVNQHLLLVSSLLLTAAGTAVAPWCTQFSLLVLVIAFQGISMGFLDTGGNVMCIHIWGKGNGPWMQALHFAFGLGAFVAPLLAEPFLSTQLNSTNISISSLNGSFDEDFTTPLALDLSKSHMDRHRRGLLWSEPFLENDLNSIAARLSDKSTTSDMTKGTSYGETDTGDIYDIFKRSIKPRKRKKKRRKGRKKAKPRKNSNQNEQRIQMNSTRTEGSLSSPSTTLKTNSLDNSLLDSRSDTKDYVKVKISQAEFTDIIMKKISEASIVRQGADGKMSPSSTPPDNMEEYYALWKLWMDRVIESNSYDITDQMYTDLWQYLKYCLNIVIERYLIYPVPNETQMPTSDDVMNAQTELGENGEFSVENSEEEKSFTTNTAVKEFELSDAISESGKTELSDGERIIGGSDEIDSDTESGGTEQIDRNTDNDGTEQIGRNADNQITDQTDRNTENVGTVQIETNTNNDGTEQTDRNTASAGVKQTERNAENKGTEVSGWNIDSVGTEQIDRDIDNDGTEQTERNTDNDGTEQTERNTDTDGTEQTESDTDNDGTPGRDWKLLSLDIVRGMAGELTIPNPYDRHEKAPHPPNGWRDYFAKWKKWMDIFLMERNITIDGSMHDQLWQSVRTALTSITKAYGVYPEPNLPVENVTRRRLRPVVPQAWGGSQASQENAELKSESDKLEEGFEPNLTSPSNLNQSQTTQSSTSQIQRSDWSSVGKGPPVSSEPPQKQPRPRRRRPDAMVSKSRIKRAAEEVADNGPGNAENNNEGGDGNAENNVPGSGLDIDDIVKINNTLGNMTETTLKPSTALPGRPKSSGLSLNKDPDVASGKILKHIKTAKPNPPTTVANKATTFKSTAAIGQNNVTSTSTSEGTTSTSTATTTTTTTTTVSTTTTLATGLSRNPPFTEPINVSTGVNVTSNASQPNKTLDSTNDLSIDNVRKKMQNFAVTVTKAIYGFSKVQFAYLTIAAYIFVVAVVFAFLCCRNRCTLRAHRVSDNSMEYTRRSESKGFRYQTLLLLFIFYFLYVGMEVTYGGLLMTFTVQCLGWSKTKGTMVTSVFWGSFAAGRGVAIFLARCCIPPAMLILDLVLTNIALVALVMSLDTHPDVIWYASAILGIGMASIFPTGITWAERYMEVTGKSTAVFVVGSALGEMLLPALTGFMFEAKGPMWLLYLMLGSAVLCIIVYIVMQNLASNYGVRYNQVKSYRRSILNHDNHMDVDMENLALNVDLSDDNDAMGGAENRGRRRKSTKRVTFDLTDDAKSARDRLQNKVKGSILKVRKSMSKT